MDQQQNRNQRDDNLGSIQINGQALRHQIRRLGPANLSDALIRFLTPPGSIIAYAGLEAPTGWLLCYGQNVSRKTYAALFGAIGTTYGAGDSVSTFTLPDMRGRTVAGQDDMGGTSADRLTGVTGSVNGDNLGAAGGEETHTLITAEIPAHTHTQDSHNHTQDSHNHSVDTIFSFTQNNGAANTDPAAIRVGADANRYSAQTQGGPTATGSETATNQAATATNQNTGGGGAHNNVQPTIVLNYLIKT